MGHNRKALLSLSQFFSLPKRSLWLPAGGRGLQTADEAVGQVTAGYRLSHQHVFYAPGFFFPTLSFINKNIILLLHIVALDPLLEPLDAMRRL